MKERRPIGLSVPYRKKPAGGMKCPLCGAATDVKETRKREDNSLVRRRVCFNEHIFTTRETVITPPKENT